MTTSEDSNVVYRGGLEGLEFIKNEAKRILNNFSVEEVSKFDIECIKRNLSPGGSADLLAVTAMLHMIIK
jgi:triphosphoribosyl-dephospho-CoA synthetase